jgi:SAM-dependent methyltransferase
VTDGPVDDLVAWDRVAETYVSQPRVDWFDDFFDRHLGNVDGKRVLDLGCGHGWFADRLVRLGADVDAVDGSTELLDIGRAAHPNVSFRHVDLRDGITGDYDVVVALMVLMDVADLSVLRPRLRAGGVLLATILHPAFFLQKTVDDERGGYRQVRRYLDEEEWWIESFGGHRHYHRPISKYVEWLSALGLGVVELFEPPAASYEGWRARIPTRLGLAARPLT